MRKGQVLLKERTGRYKQAMTNLLPRPSHPWKITRLELAAKNTIFVESGNFLMRRSCGSIWGLPKGKCAVEGLDGKRPPEQGDDPLHLIPLGEEAKQKFGKESQEVSTLSH